MWTVINGRLSALERRVAAVESAVTIPENSSGGSGAVPGGARGGLLGATTRGFTVGEAVQANGQVRRRMRGEGVLLLAYRWMLCALLSIGVPFGVGLEACALPVV